MLVSVTSEVSPGLARILHEGNEVQGQIVFFVIHDFRV